MCFQWFCSSVAAALEYALLKLSVLYIYVDGTLVIRPRGCEKLGECLVFLKGFHQNICFTLKVEESGQLPFLDVLAYKKLDGTLGQHVYRKPTHTDLYLNQACHHCLKQKENGSVNRAW